MGPETAPGGVYRIDVHAHLPVDLHGPSDGGGPARLPWSTTDAVDRLDPLLIRHQVLSMPGLVSTPSADGTTAADLARSINDTFATIIDEAPDRFSAFATVPADDVEAALAEAQRALDLPGFRGIGLTSNVAGRYLGDPWYEPLFELAESRNVPVFVHPAMNPLAAPLTLGRPPFLVEFPLDTFRSAIDAVYAGVYARHPGLKMILAHCGGALPALAWRVSSLADLVRGEGAGPSPEDVDRAIGSFYLDTALSGSPEVLRSAADVVGHDHLLYGTDCGAASDDLIIANTDGLTRSGLSVAERAGVETNNAASLLGLPPSAFAP